MKKISLSFLILFAGSFVFAQSLAPLTVEKIMRDPKWMGASPSDPLWSADGKTLYFNWNPDKMPADSLYYITSENKIPQKATVFQKQDIVYARDIRFNAVRTMYVYAKDDDIFMVNSKTGKTKRITQTTQKESHPAFSFSDTKVIYLNDHNVFAWDIANGEIIQLTNFQKGNPPPATDSNKKLNSQEEWLKKDQLQWMEVLKERKEKKDAKAAYEKTLPQKKILKPIYTGDKTISGITVSPNARFVTYIVSKPEGNTQKTIIDRKSVV